jgi:hypothetical protein
LWLWWIVELGWRREHDTSEQCDIALGIPEPCVDRRDCDADGFGDFE